MFWLAPLVWTLYTSLRPYSDTAEHGYVSLPGELTLDNYTNAWTQADMPHYFLNTLIITIPAVLIVLFLAVVRRVRRHAAGSCGSTSRC